MFGEQGAAYVFGPQKGADEACVALLDRNLRALNDVIVRDLGCQVADLPGAGAAGAFGAGCVAFFGVSLLRGIEVVLDAVHFDELLKDTDLVITGEGRIDSQSVQGKVISGVARRAKAQNVPVFAIVGDVRDDAYSAYDIGISAIYSINRLAIPTSEAKQRSTQDYTRTLDDILRGIRVAEGFVH